jgi:hypothetical protein
MKVESLNENCEILKRLHMQCSPNSKERMEDRLCEDWGILGLMFDEHWNFVRAAVFVNTDIFDG